MWIHTCRSENLEPIFALEELYRDRNRFRRGSHPSDRTWVMSCRAGSAGRLFDATTHIKGAYNKGAAEALAELRDIVDRNAGPT